MVIFGRAENDFQVFNIKTNLNMHAVRETKTQLNGLINTCSHRQYMHIMRKKVEYRWQGRILLASKRVTKPTDSNRIQLSLRKERLFILLWNRKFCAAFKVSLFDERVLRSAKQILTKVPDLSFTDF